MYRARLLKDSVDLLNSAVLQNQFPQVGRHRIAPKEKTDSKLGTERPNTCMWNISRNDANYAGGF